MGPISWCFTLHWAVKACQGHALNLTVPIKKDFIFPDSGVQAQEDIPNVQDPESGNLVKKLHHN